MPQNHFISTIETLANARSVTPAIIISRPGFGGGCSSIITASQYPSHWAAFRCAWAKRFSCLDAERRSPVVLVHVSAPDLYNVYSGVQVALRSYRNDKTRLYRLEFSDAVSRVRSLVNHDVETGATVTSVRISRRDIKKFNVSYVWRDFAGSFWAIRKTPSSKLYVSRVTPDVFTKLQKLSRP